MMEFEGCCAGLLAALIVFVSLSFITGCVG